jgi:hypothetical protein
MPETICAIVVLLAFGPWRTPAIAKVETPKPSVEFVLRAVKPTPRVGESPARVQIEFQNHGDQDFIVGEDLLPIVNALTYVLLELTDSAGHPEPIVNMTTETAPQRASWTRIAPGHYYGIEFDLDTESYPALKRPGRYKLIAKYISKGAVTPPIPELQIPTYHVWQGELDSNTIEIQVLDSR